jgi:uncharacterized protein YukE
MTVPTPPRHFVVRTPSGDPRAVRRLATAYDELADAVLTDVHRVCAVLHHLMRTWQGSAADATRSPETALAGDAQRAAHALRRSGDDLRHYAQRLERAHEHHGWTIGRLVTLGAMVTVGVAAVVVTVGAAAPAEAAAAAAVVEAAEAATASAETAAAAAASELTSWQGLLCALRPLAPFLLPHLVSSAASAGLDGASQLLDDDLDLRSLAISAVVGFAGSAVGGAVETRLSAAPSLARRAAEAGVWATNGTAGSYADGDDLDPADTAAFALTGVVARDVRKAVDALPRVVRRCAR